MFSLLIGQVDMNAAAVLVSMFLALAVVSTSLIVKRRSRLQIDNDFKLATMEAQASAALAQYNAESSRKERLGKLEQNLITSHREEGQ